jgi:hypothetical protein
VRNLARRLSARSAVSLTAAQRVDADNLSIQHGQAARATGSGKATKRKKGG